MTQPPNPHCRPGRIVRITPKYESYDMGFTIPTQPPDYYTPHFVRSEAPPRHKHIMIWAVPDPTDEEWEIIDTIKISLALIMVVLIWLVFFT